MSASIRRAAGIKGDIDHFRAANFLAGLLLLDEVEILQRVRANTREKGLYRLRQWIDEIDVGHFPGLYLLVTGTLACFDPGTDGPVRELFADPVAFDAWARQWRARLAQE